MTSKLYVDTGPTQFSRGDETIPDVDVAWDLEPDAGQVQPAPRPVEIHGEGDAAGNGVDGSPISAAPPAEEFSSRQATDAELMVAEPATPFTSKTELRAMDAQQYAPISAAPDSSLTLGATHISPDLVVLRGDPGSALLAYEAVAGKVLHTAWNRTSLFFTSVQAGQGATEAAINLAALLSRQTESVLLVELQLTQPGLWSLLGRPQVNAGFELAMRGDATFEDCLYRIAGEKLDVVMMTNPMTLDEAGRLSGPLNEFLEWAEERFAWMIVDCPAVLTPAWTRWFSLNADPVVLVAESETTRKRELRKAAGLLGDRLAGTILSEHPKL